MKKYIESADYSSDDDFGYGYDSNGEPIDESTVDELYRVAEDEVLPKTELAKIGRATIDDDTFKYYATGTAWGASLGYVILFEVDSDALNLDKYVRREARMFPAFDMKDIWSATIRFSIVVDNSKLKTVIFEEADVYKRGKYDSYSSDKFIEQFDAGRLCDYIAGIAEQAIREIHVVLSDI